MKRKKKYVDIDIQHPAPIFVEATVRINQESSLLSLSSRTTAARHLYLSEITCKITFQLVRASITPIHACFEEGS